MNFRWTIFLPALAALHAVAFGQTVSRVPKAAPGTRVLLTAPLFLEDERWTSVLTLVNSAAEQVSVDLTLLDAAGNAAGTKVVVLAGRSHLEVALDSFRTRKVVRYGSVNILPQGPELLAGQLSITGKIAGTGSDIQEELQKPGSSGPANFRAVSASGRPVVLLRNLGAQAEEFTITCLHEGGGTSSGNVTAQASQALLVDACAAGGARAGDFDPAVLTGADSNAEEVAARSGGSGPGRARATGVSITGHGANSKIALFGVGAKAESLSGIAFANVSGMKSSTTLLPGVAGPFPNLAATVANFGTVAREVTFEATPPGGGISLRVATLTLAPGAVVRKSLTSGFEGSSSAGSLVVRTDAPAGEVVTEVHSGAAPAEFADVSLPSKDMGLTENGGQHPWRVDGGTTSTLTLYNPDANTGNTMTVTVFTGTSSWVKRVAIGPQATLTLRLNDILANREKDDKGNVLPEGAQTGLVTWFSLKNPRVVGMLTRKSARGAVRPFACGETIALCSLTLFDGTMDSGGTTLVFPQANGCISYGSCGCASSCGDTGSPSLTSYFWSSGNSSIAQLTGDASASLGQYQGLNAGSTNSFLNAGDNNGCFSSQVGNLYVNPVISSISPTNLPIGSSTQITINGSGFSGSPTLTGDDMTFTVNSVSSTQIVATVTIPGSDSGGSAGITVTAQARPSAPKPVVKQKPAKLVRLDFAGAPGGIGALQNVADGDVVNLAGQTVLTHQCGVYRNYAYDLVDQNGVSISATYMFTEYFSDYSGVSTLPSALTTSYGPNDLLTDIQYFGKNAPACPAAGDHEMFNQKFYVTLGGTRIDLSTVINIQRGNYAGTAKVDETITTP